MEGSNTTNQIQQRKKNARDGIFCVLMSHDQGADKKKNVGEYLELPEKGETKYCVKIEIIPIVIRTMVMYQSISKLILMLLEHQKFMDEHWLL